MSAQEQQPSASSAHHETHVHDGATTYFMSGEFVILVEPDGEQTPESLKEWVHTFWASQVQALNSTYGDYALNYELTTAVIFPGETGRRALMKVVVPSLLVPGEFSIEASIERGRDSAAVVNTVNSFIICSEDPEADTPPVRPVAITPNWLFGGQPHVFFHPSPGGRPAVPNTQYYQGRHEFQMDQIDPVIQKWPKSMVGQEVNVVIFDSVPPKGQEIALTQVLSAHAVSGNRFETAYQVYEPMSRASTALKDKLKIIYADEYLPPGQALPPIPQVPHNPAQNHYTSPDNYEMSDHGLFIAGIIHSIAPQANIKLVEVMNTYGAGNIDTLVYAIDAIRNGTIPLDNPSNQTLIVNCSLSVDCPQPNRFNEIVLTNVLIDGRRLADIVMRYADRLLAPMDVTFEQFERVIGAFTNDALVIAAAGNDGLQPNGEPHPARFPAAFDYVLGVGAMEDETTRAQYSNLADNPSFRGIMAFGGRSNSFSAMGELETGQQVQVRWNETTDQEGMLGLYTGVFPTTDSATGQVVRAQAFQSPNGWAMWSGTSFATGVVTGMFARAALAGIPVSLHNSCNFYRALESEGFPVTRYGELVVYTPQGMPPAPAAPPNPPPVRLSLWQELRNAISRWWNSRNPNTSN